ncbi:hypothetical protein SALBM311S_05012 [Streptomyces alboniger]
MPATGTANAGRFGSARAKKDGGTNTAMAADNSTPSTRKGSACTITATNTVIQLCITGSDSARRIGPCASTRRMSNRVSVSGELRRRGPSVSGALTDVRPAVPRGCFGDGHGRGTSGGAEGRWFPSPSIRLTRSGRSMRAGTARGYGVPTRAGTTRPVQGSLCPLWQPFRIRVRRVTRARSMVACGDDGLAHRLAAELREVYGERVTLVVPPSERSVRPPVVGRAITASALLDRVVNAAVNRGGGNGASDPPAPEARVVEAAEPAEAALAEAGVDRAAALALVYDDDETNIRAALTARRLNPRLRLVLRLYNRRLGQHIEELLDQAAALATGGTTGPTAVFDASTTVMSDADTAAPALAASAIVGTSKVVQTDGLLLRAVERPPPGPGRVADPGLATLALLSSTGNDPAGADGSDSGDDQGPRLLPDAATVRAATGRGTVVLEQVSYSGPALPAGRGSYCRSPRCSRVDCGGRWRDRWGA